MLLKNTSNNVQLQQLIARGESLLSGDPFVAKSIAGQVLHAIRTKPDLLLTVRALNLLAGVNRHEQNLIALEKCAAESLGLVLSLDDPAGERDALRMMAAATGAGTGESASVPRRHLREGLPSVYSALGLTPADTALAVTSLESEVSNRQALLGQALNVENRRAGADEGPGQTPSVIGFVSLAALHRECGDWDRAVEFLCRALVELERSESPRVQAVCRTDIGEIYLRRGRRERGAEELETARKLALESKDHAQVLRVDCVLAKAYALLGDPLRAHSILDQCIASADDRELAVQQVRARRRKAELLTDEQAPADATNLLRRAFQIAGQAGLTAEIGNLLRVAGRGFELSGDSQPAHDSFEFALGFQDRAGRLFDRARALGDYGRFLSGQGHEADALVQLRRAAEIYRRLEAVSESSELEHEMLKIDTGQDRRLLLVRALSSVIGSSPSRSVVEDSLAILRQGLGFERGAFFFRAGQRLLGSSPEHWPEPDSRDEVIKTCLEPEPAKGTNTLCLPLSLADRPVGALYLRWAEPGGSTIDSTLQAIIANLSAIAVARATEATIPVLVGQARNAPDKAPAGFAGMVGRAPAMQSVYEQIRQVAPTRAPILIRGDSGTGKELVARSIHELSPRAGRPFVALNCAAMPETLLESELFGVEKGVATGVTARSGKFEQASQGTLFLDEIGDMSLALQAKVLRVLNDQHFERVGGRQTIAVDVRVVAATLRDLEQAMQTRKFRSDLFYRLNVVTIQLPPLRKRREDIVLLARHFISRYNTEFGRRVKGLSPEVSAVFQRYAWPGNVRELLHAIERAVILCRSEMIQVGDLPPALQQLAESSPVAEEAQEPAIGRAESIRELRSATRKLEVAAAEDLERDLIVRALEASKWNAAKSARTLGVSRAQFYRLLKKHGIGRAQAGQ